MIQEIDCPGSSVSHVGQQQLSYLCSPPKMVRCSDTGVLGRPWGLWDALSTERSPSVTWKALLGPGTHGGFAWFYLGIHSETRHGGGPPRDSVVLSVHGKVAATVRGLHSLKLPNLWLLEINTQPSSCDEVGAGQRAASAPSAGDRPARSTERAKRESEIYHPSRRR